MMTCDDVRRHLSAFTDAEVPREVREGILRHLDDCPRCSRARAELADVSLLVRAAPQPATPVDLADRIRSGLRVRSEAAARARAWTWGAGASLASAASAAVVTAVLLGQPRFDGGVRPPAVADALAAHVRSLLDDRGGRIRSDDPHTLRPWFAGRLPFAPPTPDFAAEGYPLVGARVDYVGERLVAAISYRRRQHIVTVFLWPQPSPGETAPTFSAARNGYNVAGGGAAGFVVVAVSELNPDELAALRSMILAKLAAR